MRDTDDDEPYETRQFGEEASDRAAWLSWLVLIAVAAVVGACCVGWIYFIRTR